MHNAALCEMHGSKPRDRPGAEREAKHGTAVELRRLLPAPGNAAVDPLGQAKFKRADSGRARGYGRRYRSSTAQESQMNKVPLLLLGSRMTRNSSGAGNEAP